MAAQEDRQNGVRLGWGKWIADVTGTPAMLLLLFAAFIVALILVLQLVLNTNESAVDRLAATMQTLVLTMSAEDRRRVDEHEALRTEAKWRQEALELHIEQGKLIVRSLTELYKVIACNTRTIAELGATSTETSELRQMILRTFPACQRLHEMEL